MPDWAESLKMIKKKKEKIHQKDTFRQHAEPSIFGRRSVPLNPCHCPTRRSDCMQVSQSSSDSGDPQALLAALTRCMFCGLDSFCWVNLENNHFGNVSKTERLQSMPTKGLPGVDEPFVQPVFDRSFRLWEAMWRCTAVPNAAGTFAPWLK